MTRKTSLLAVAALLLLLPAQLRAGGPPWLALPIDGVTSENASDCVDLLSGKLKGKFFTEPDQFSGVKILRDGDQAYVTLFVADEVGLHEIDSALQGSRFSVPRNRLHLFGHVTLVIDPRASPPQELLADLEALDHVSVAKSNDNHGELLVTVDMPYPVEDGRPWREVVGWKTFERNELASDPATKSEPAASPGMLPSYVVFGDIVAKHHAALKDIRWTTEYACRPVGGVAVPRTDASITATQSAAINSK